MNDSINKLKIYICSLFGITAICIVLFTASMFVLFDIATGYFNSSPLIHVQNVLVIISIAFFASILFFIKKDTLPTKLNQNQSEIMFPSLFCGVLYALGTAMAFISVVNNASKITDSSKYVFFGIIISGLLSAAYFIFDALLSDERYPSLKTISAIFLIINLFLSIVYQHLDFFVGINTPRKTLLFIGFATASLFIVQELRSKVGETQPRAYVFFGSCAVLICSILSIPGIITHVSGTVKDGAFLPFYLTSLALAVYISAKLFIYGKNAE